MRRARGILAVALGALVAAAPANAEWPVEFRPYDAHQTSSWPEVVKIADVTGDGRNDVLLTTSFYFDEANDFKLFLFAQRPDGSLAAPKRYDVSGGIGTGDLDGDGDTDVAVTTGDGVVVLRQSGGTLGPPRLLVNSPHGGDGAVADMNGDGLNDIVVSGDGLHVVMNEGGGRFGYSTVGIYGVGDVETVDVNADGMLDIVGLGGANDFTQYLHNADGTYTVRAYELAHGAYGMGVGELTGDGRNDFVFSAGGNRPDSKVVLIPQLPDGTPSPTSQVYRSYDIPEPVEVRDLNGDGRADVITLHGGWLEAGYYFQTTAGTLSRELLAGIPYASHYDVKGLDVGDINCDGRADLAIADYNAGLVVVGQTAPAAMPATCPPPDPVPSGAATPQPPPDGAPGGALPAEPTRGGEDGLPWPGAGGAPGEGTGAPGGGGSGPDSLGGPEAPGAGYAGVGTHYGGTARRGGRIFGTSISLRRRPDGRVGALAGLSYSCGSRTYPNVVVPLAGLTHGAAFDARGSTRLTRRGRLRVTLEGTLAGETASGTVRVRPRRMRGCRGYSLPFVLRSESLPSGAAAMPSAGALATGVTAQAAAGIRLPIALGVSGNGRRVSALWQATMRCGGGTVSMATNFTPATAMRGDATFTRSERFSIRYGDGTVARYRMTLRGRFVEGGGALGTLRAQMRAGRELRCDSGTQRWTATAAP